MTRLSILSEEDNVQGRIHALRRIPAAEALIVFGGVLAAMAGGLLLTLPDELRQPALVVLAGLVTAAPIVVRAVQGRWDPFEPIVVLCVPAFVIYFLRPVWMWSHNEWFFSVYDTRKGLTGAAAIVIIGMGGLGLGYFLDFGRRIGHRIPAIGDRWDWSRVVTACLVLLGIAALLFLVYVGRGGGTSALTQYFSGRSSFDATLAHGAGGQNVTSAYFYLAPYMTIPIALVLLEVWRRKRTLFHAVLAFGVTALALAMTVPRGDRTFVLALAVPLIALPYLFRGRRPRVLSIVAALLMMILVFNVLFEFRRQEARHGTLPHYVAGALSNPSKQVDDLMLGADTAMFSILAAQYTATPGQLEYHPGQALTSMVLLPVPSLIWKGKPDDPAQLVYYGLFPTSAAQTKAGFGSSMLGGFYADSGFAGVFLYCLLVGVAARALFEYWRRHQDNRSVTVLYASLLPLLVIMLRSTPTLTVGGMLFLTAPMIAAFWWGNRASTAVPRRAEVD